MKLVIYKRKPGRYLLGTSTLGMMYDVLPCSNIDIWVRKKPRKKHEEEETEVERGDIKDTVAEQ